MAIGLTIILLLDWLRKVRSVGSPIGGIEMATSLKGKVALVTGGSSGIGRATALAFAREGAKVVIADVDVEGGHETVRMVKEASGESTFVKTDVSKAAEVEALIAQTVQGYGRLDCAFNNAGIAGATASTADYTEGDWDSVIAINLKSVWLCMKYEIPQMLGQGGGAIVNASSINGLIGNAGKCGYDASKHGVIGLTKTAAIEYARAGIRANAVCPGVIRTPMAYRSPRFDEAKWPGLQPIGRLGMPEEVAEAVVWLCSDVASFVTGHSMLVDGGYVAQ